MPLPAPADVSNFSTGVFPSPIIFSSSVSRCFLHSGAFQEVPDRFWRAFSDADLLEGMFAVADFRTSLILNLEIVRRKVCCVF